MFASALTGILDWLSGLSMQDAYYLAAILMAPIGLVLLYDRGESARAQAEAAAEQVRTSQADYLNNHYRQAAEMIQSERRSTRVAGFYSLKHLMREHPADYHVMAMQLICMFVRNPHRQENDDGSRPLTGSHGYLREDIQAAMEVIGTRTGKTIRLEKDAKFRAVLWDAPLRKVHLENANLSYVWLQGADLREAFVRKINLSDAALARGNFAGARFHDTIFSGAVITDAVCVSAMFSSCDLSDTWLSETKMTKAVFRDTNFADAIMGDCDFTGARLDARCRITQWQLDNGIADPLNPPTLAKGLVDYETGLPLVWNTAHCGRNWKDGLT